MTAYYNENDPKAAAWLRELIKQGHIAPGDVDERSISNVKPFDVKGYTQCHYFAGIGVWSFALRQAGWPDDKPVWTGSCPCQPFSSAGKRSGTSDERHLWPHWQWLIAQCRPREIFGEQVASKDGRSWFDLVSSDLEGMGYAAGAVDMCAAGVGAPHIRQRLWFYATLADADGVRRARFSGRGKERITECRDVNRLADDQSQQRSSGATSNNETRRWGEEPATIAGYGGASGVGNTPSQRRREAWESLNRSTERQSGVCDDGGLGNACGKSSQRDTRSVPSTQTQMSVARDKDGRLDQRHTDAVDAHRPAATNGFWRDADWLLCRDEPIPKFRPVEPRTFPLADGSPARVGRLRGYGNAIVAPVAQAFIEAVIDVT